MPAFDASNCGKECKTLSRVFYDAARMMKTMPPWQAMMFVANLMNKLETDQKLTHTVWAGEGDGFPGTLIDKLEAGANIALNNKAPSGATGRAASEVIVEIVGTNDAIATVDADSGSQTDVTRLSIDSNDDWLTTAVTGPSGGHALVKIAHNTAQGAGTTFKFYTGIGEEATITIDDNGHISAVKTAPDQANLTSGANAILTMALGNSP